VFDQFLAREAQIFDSRTIAIAAASVVMVVCGAFVASLSDAVALALIVIGAGMFFIGMLLPTLSEFEIGPGGFSAKLRERDEEIKATLDPDTENLMHAATLLAGGGAAGKELLERALAETYLQWKQAKREGPADAVLKRLDELAPASAQRSPTAAGGAK
jgi:hypothetical protein